MIQLSDFDYALPKELIAQYPADTRDASRMLVLDRKNGGIAHKKFTDFPGYIKKEDILVLNNTKVINVRLIGRRLTGGRTEIFLTEKLGSKTFKALLKPSARIREKDQVIFDGSNLKAWVVAKEKGGNIVQFTYTGKDIEKELARIGSVPLPPYIKRSVELLDGDRYQTVYAKRDGATAAPTAGLHFTNAILNEVASKGAKTAYLTLHVNYGTFAPVKTEDITKHKMHSEAFELSEGAANSINKVKENGGRIFAVGTTAVRVLETCAAKVTTSPGHQVTARSGKTDIFIYPPYEFKIVDALLTNFHFPKSTLLMLVSAFAGRELILKAYEEAIRERYRFFSYGDCMLII